MNFFEYVSCDLCGSKERTILLPIKVDGYESAVVRCMACGLIYCTPIPKLEWTVALHSSIQRFYDLPFVLTNVPNYIEGLQIIKREKGSSGNLLDVGCGSGIFLLIAEKAGFSVQGCDIQQEHIAFAKQFLGFRVQLGDVESLEFKEGQYDFITLWDVIEHLRRPNTVIQKLYNFMKDDGLLFIVTPNYNFSFYVMFHPVWRRLQRALVGRRDKSDVTHSFEHLYFWTPKTLRLLLEQNGFKSVKFYPRLLYENLIEGVPFARECIYLAKKLIFRISFGRVNIYPTLVVTARK